MRRFALGVVILSALAAAFLAVVSRDPMPRSSDARLERVRVAREARERRLRQESRVPRLPSPDSGLSHSEAMARFWQGVGLLEEGDFWGAAPHLSAAHEAMPEHDSSCLVLADIFYRLNLVRDAVDLLPCLARAAERGLPSASKLLETIERGADIEGRFQLATSEHFLASFPVGGESEQAIGRVLDRLERGRDGVAAQIGFASDRLISVVIYEGGDLNHVTGSPSWMPGLFDGKIRLDSELLALTPGRLGAVLTHEYVHALLHQLAGRRMPHWMHEGLAVLLSGERLDSEPMVERLRSRQVLPDLRELSGGYSRMSKDRADLAYRQAYWMLRDLVDGFGWDDVAAFLGQLEQDPHAPFDQAFQESFGEVPEVYLDRWYDDWLGRS